MKNKSKKSTRKSLFSSMKNDKRGSLFDLPVQLMMLFIALTFLVAMLPAFMEMIGMSKQSTSLNCKGYVDDVDPSLSYNETLAAGGHISTMACMAMSMFVPYLVLGVLIAGVAALMYGKSQGGDSGYTG